MAEGAAGEKRMTAGVTAAFQRFLREARLLGWQTLLVGSGLWVEAAVCAERFIVDLGEAWESRQARPETAWSGHWSSRVVNRVQGSLVRAVRWSESGVRAWQRLATRTDVALLDRRGRAGR